MDPVTIGLAIAGAKKLIETAGDLKEIVVGIDNLLSAQEAKPPKKKKPKTRMQQILRMRSGDEDYDDETSISSVANDVLEARQQEVAIASLKKEIDRKWGQGTWDSIVDEREKRVAAKAEKQKKAKAVAAAKADENKEFWDTILYWVVEASKLGAVLVVAGGIIYWVWSSRCTEGTC
jgi:hypothetical protein